MTLSDWDVNLQEIQTVLSDPVLTLEEQMERRVDWIVRELDELCAMAANPETVDLVDAQRIAIGQIVSRAQLIASFLMARKPQLKVISNV